MGKILGYNFLMFIKSGSTNTPIGGSKTCSFDSKIPTIDISSRDGRDFLLDQEEYSLSCDGVVDFILTGNTYVSTSVAQLYYSKATFTWSFGTNSGTTVPQTLDTTQKYFTGSGSITDFKVSSNMTGAVEYNITIKGRGNSSIV